MRSAWLGKKETFRYSYIETSTVKVLLHVSPQGGGGGYLIPGLINKGLIREGA